MFFKRRKKPIVGNPKYKIFNDPYGGGYAVTTDTHHIEYFEKRKDAIELRDRLNSGLCEEPKQ